MRRRYDEVQKGIFDWQSIFIGKGIDVGCSDDKIPFDECIPFDLEQGDANNLSAYFPENHFDYLHSSQSLEHMHSPKECLIDWIRVVKPGGYLVVTVPSWELYEGMRWPSVSNPDHKSTWSMVVKGSPAPIHVHLPSFLKEISHLVTTKICRLVDSNYDYSVGVTRDQTYIEADGAEAFYEFVLQKSGSNPVSKPKKEQEIAPEKGNIFLHSHDLGDIIACLPTIRQLGGGKLVLTDSPAGLTPMAGARFNFISRLLEKSPYLTSVEYQKTPRNITHSFLDFRGLYNPKITLADTQAKYLGVDNLNLDPWIMVEPDNQANGRVIVARSPRYNNPKFPWKKIARHYQRKMLFVGMPSEHEAFQKLVNMPVQYQPIGNMLELAQLIQASDLFIGNQSSPCWIAMALGHRLIQETWEKQPDSIVLRPNAQFCFDHRVILV